MSKYLETAGEANEIARRLLDLVPEDDRPHAAELVARLVNLGIRCSPRGVQHTVRFNAVQRACRDLPVRVGMEQRKCERTGRVYHALTTQPTGSGVQTVEHATED